MIRAEKALNIEDLRQIARRMLPAWMLNYIEGGADDESNVRGNTKAFGNCDLVPEYLVDIANIDLSTRILGRDISMPLFHSHTGISRMFHHRGESGCLVINSR